MDFLIEALGFLGGVIGTIQAFPQAMRIRKLGHGFGVSIISWSMMYARSVAWLGYSIATLLTPLILSNFIAAVAGAMVVVALMKSKPANWALLIGGGLALVAAFALLPADITNPVLLFVTLFVRVPQLAKTWQTRNSGKVSAISISSLALSLISLACWLVYFVVREQHFLVLTTSIALIFTLLISGIEYYAMRKNKTLLHQTGAALAATTNQ